MRVFPSWLGVFRSFCVAQKKNRLHSNLVRLMTDTRKKLSHKGSITLSFNVQLKDQYFSAIVVLYSFIYIITMG